MSNSPVTRRVAAERGLSRRSLERGDNPFRGVWTPSAPTCLAERCRAFLAASVDDMWFSHLTAANLHGLWLPPRCLSLDRIDATTAAPRHSPRGRGVRGRQRSVATSLVCDLGGLPVSTPAQTFVDLVDVLGPSDLVAAGDSVLSRWQPLATRDQIDHAVAEHAGRRGHRRLVAAVAELTDRSRSRPESLYRIAFLDAGVAMPQLNRTIQLRPGGPTYTPDFAWWEAAVMAEYEGDQHPTDRSQWQYDLQRYNDLQDAGWEIRRYSLTTPAAMRRDAAAIAELVRRRWRPDRRLPILVPDPPPSFPVGTF